MNLTSLLRPRLLQFFMETSICGRLGRGSEWGGRFRVQARPFTINWTNWLVMPSVTQKTGANSKMWECPIEAELLFLAGGLTVRRINS